MMVRWALLCVFAVAAFGRAQPCEVRYSDEFANMIIDGLVTDLARFDAGAGEAVILAGAFTAIGSEPAAGMAIWDGEEIRPLDHPLEFVAGPRFNDIETMVIDGKPWLYISGTITAVGSTIAHGVARWDGSTWEAVPFEPFAGIARFRMFDLGAGPQLFGVGAFAPDETRPGYSFAQMWVMSPLGFVRHGPPVPYTIPGQTQSYFTDAAVITDDATGERRLLGGGYVYLPDGSAGLLELIDGEWTGFRDAVSGQVSVLERLSIAGGPERLYAGSFTVGLGAEEHSIAVWNGSAWEALGPQRVYGRISRILAVPGAGGNTLVVAGDELRSDPEGVLNIAEWDGTQWNDLNGGLEVDFDGVHDAIVFENDGRTELVAALNTARYEPRPRCTTNGSRGLARWFDGRWHAPSFTASMSLGGAQLTMEPAAGGFVITGLRNIDGLPGSELFMRTGDAWHTPAPGLCGIHGAVEADIGAGPQIIACGRFDDGVAVWDGAAWSIVGEGDGALRAGTGLGEEPVETVAAGSFRGAPRIFAGGSFKATRGGAPVRRIAFWDGAAWKQAGAGFTLGTVRKVRIFGPPGDERLAIIHHNQFQDKSLSIYDGVDLQYVGTASGRIREIAPARIDGEHVVLAFGEFDFFESEEVDGVVCVRPDGTVMESPLRRPPGIAQIEAAHVEPAPGGPIVYVVGPSDREPGKYACARWWNGGWDLFQDEFDGKVLFVRLIHSGDAKELWFFGEFTAVGATSALGFARRPACDLFCPADLDLDGVLTFFDFLTFSNLFSSSDPVADRDHDGAFTFFDFLAFQSEYAAGCP